VIVLQALRERFSKDEATKTARKARKARKAQTLAKRRESAARSQREKIDITHHDRGGGGGF
jgi:hypothetical protein